MWAQRWSVWAVQRGWESDSLFAALDRFKNTVLLSEVDSSWFCDSAPLETVTPTTGTCFAISLEGLDREPWKWQMPCTLVSHPRGSSEVSDGGHVSKVKRSWGYCGWTVGDYHSKHIIMLFPRIKFGFHGSSFTKGILFINSNCGVVAQRAGNLNLWQSYTQRFHLAITCDLASQEVVLYLYFSKCK